MPLGSATIRPVAVRSKYSSRPFHWTALFETRILSDQHPKACLAQSLPLSVHESLHHSSEFRNAQVSRGFTHLAAALAVHAGLLELVSSLIGPTTKAAIPFRCKLFFVRSMLPAQDLIVSAARRIYCLSKRCPFSPTTLPQHPTIKLPNSEAT